MESRCKDSASERAHVRLYARGSQCKDSGSVCGRDPYVRILYARSFVKDSVRIRDPKVRTLYVEIDMYELHLRGYRYVKILYVESPCKDSVWGVLMKGFLSVHRSQGAPHGDFSCGVLM